MAPGASRLHAGFPAHIASASPSRSLRGDPLCLRSHSLVSALFCCPRCPRRKRAVLSGPPAAFSRRLYLRALVRCPSAPAPGLLSVPCSISPLPLLLAAMGRPLSLQPVSVLACGNSSLSFNYVTFRTVVPPAPYAALLLLCRAGSAYPSPLPLLRSRLSFTW